jgi:RNA polymerase sigma factor (sigma-70 family)
MKSSFSTDTDIKKSLDNRSIEAFEYLYTNSRIWLYGIAYSIVQDRTIAKDLVQELFSDLWEFKLYTNVTGSIKGYLLISIKNRAINLMKAMKTEKKLKSSYIYPTDVIAPTIRLEQEQLKQAIEDAIKKVPRAAAEAFRLHYMEGLSHEQVAIKQDISHHTVRNQISSALKILRRELKNIKNE